MDRLSHMPDGPFPQVMDGPADDPDQVVADPARAPGPPRTLPAVLEWRAGLAPDRRALTFLQDGETETGHLTQGALAGAAGRIAGALAARGVGPAMGPGLEGAARVLLLYPAGLDFVQAFMGTLRAGAVAVPAPHAQGGRSQAARLAAIAADAAPALVLTTTGLCAETEAALGPAIPVTTIEALLAGAQEMPPPLPAPDALALIQYTSGSTGNPRGVMITHAAIMANQRMITERFGHSPATVCVGWLPMFHDMGLIGNLLQPLYAGYLSVLMPPVAFLEDPLHWLAAITRYGAGGGVTGSGITGGAPNFAYDLCVDRIAPADRADLDLRGWTIAYSGSEPVRAATLDRFAAAFAPYGFRRRAFYPCYGMAEATLLIAGGEVADLAPRVTVTEPGQAPRSVVGCGAPGADHAVLVVDPETHSPLPAGQTGEIWFAGPSVGSGYWQRPAETAAMFGASPADRDDPRWLRTGDLGFVQGAEVFVTGRIKDVLIVKGRNHYPQDLEATAQASHPGLRPDCGAAFLVEGPDGAGRDRQALVIVHEVTAAVLRAPPVAEIAGAMRAAISRDHGLHLAVVALIRPGSLPKTTSGKLQRARTRAAFLAGTLPLLAEDRHGPAFWKTDTDTAQFTLSHGSDAR
jgi:acyl-CoA synthetase (AMP-forming)/AMP-acid ligase II